MAQLFGRAFCNLIEECKRDNATGNFISHNFYNNLSLFFKEPKRKQ